MRATRVACVWCPDWPVVAWRRSRDDLHGVPIAVLEHGAVRAASAEARVEQVTVGLRRREAEARCPGLAVLPSDPRGEAVAFEAVARSVEVFTPSVELEEPGRLTFPTRGPSRYFGGDDALARRVTVAVRAVGVSEVRVGIADGRFAAALAARRDEVVPPATSAGFLAPWPITALDDPELTGILARLGLRTLGAFAALPPPAVLARFGEAGARARSRAGGFDDRPVMLAPLPPDLIETAELDPPAERVDVAAFAGKGLADRLLARLADRGLGCTRVIVEAETEHGEQLARCWRHEGALTPTALAERVRWQLDGWLACEGRLSGGLTRLRLVPDEVVPATGRQLGFWGGDQAAAERADRALARVQGMLGLDAVAVPVPRGGRTPTERVRWVPWGESREAVRDAATSTEAAWPGAVPGPAPARVFDPPIPAELLDAADEAITVSARGEASAHPTALRCPMLSGAVDACAGPWPHDVRWWDRTRQRCVRWQLVVDGTACLVVLERGCAALEAIYD